MVGIPCVYGPLSFRRDQALDAFEGVDFHGATEKAIAISKENKLSSNVIGKPMSTSLSKYTSKDTDKMTGSQRRKLPPLNHTARVSPHE